LHSVLLVDDEWLVLEGLERIIPWPQLELEVVGKQTDGESAMEFMRRNQVDILLSDIKMPNMTGLELAKEALLVNPQLKIIFMSGHEDFEYARNALELNALAYVLKPIPYDELQKKLLEAVRQIRILNTRQESMQWAKERQLLSILSSSFEGEAVHADLETIFNAGQLTVAVLEMDNMAGTFDDGALLSDGKESLSRTNRTRSILLGRKCAIAEWQPRQLVVVFPYQEQETTNILKELFAAASEGESFTAGVSSTRCNVSDLPELFRQACEALGYKMFKGKGNILHFKEQMSTKDTIDKLELERLMKALFHAVIQYRVVNIYDRLKQFFEYVAQIESKLAVYHFTVHLLNKLEQELQETLNEDFLSLMNWDIANFESIYQFETIHDVRQWLTKRMYELSETIHHRDSGKNRRLIEQIEAYVHKHVEGNVTLKDLSNHFMLSPNYIGTLFKAGKGEQFSDYLIRKKLERVKELLDDPQIKIYEAADRLGYKNMSYFYKAFKERFGVSPGEYRKLKS
jgi:two-component system response regulator YesN